MDASAVDLAARVGEAAAALGGLDPALRWLDGVLRRAVADARVAYGPGAAADPFRGLHLGPDDADRLLAREPGASPFPGGAEPAWPGAADGSRLAWLGRAFALSPFDLG